MHQSPHADIVVIRWELGAVEGSGRVRFMAELAAGKLLQQLQRAGFVVMKKPLTPPGRAP